MNNKHKRNGFENESRITKNRLDHLKIGLGISSLKERKYKYLIKSTENFTNISGYASVFNIIDHDNDIIQQGVFKELDPSKVKLLWQHDSTKPIGVIKNLFEDEYGIRIEAEINNDITLGKEVSSLIKQEAVLGLSVGFIIKDYKHRDDKTRVILSAELLEVSVVTFPANSKALIDSFKSLTHYESTKDIALCRLEQLTQKLLTI